MRFNPSFEIGFNRFRFNLKIEEIYTNICIFTSIFSYTSHWNDNRLWMPILIMDVTEVINKSELIYNLYIWKKRPFLPKSQLPLSILQLMFTFPKNFTMEHKHYDTITIRTFIYITFRLLIS